MGRSALSDHEVLLPSMRDEPSRSAAIAAMGYRLAAAGPRTRQRLLDRRAAPEDVNQDHDTPVTRFAASDEAAGSVDDDADGELFADDDDELVERPPLARGVVIGRIALLTVAAACGFGAVLYAQGPEGAKPHHHQVAAQLAAEPPEPADPAAVISTQDLADQQLAPPPATLEQPLPLRSQLPALAVTATERPPLAHVAAVVVVPPVHATGVVMKRPEAKPHVSHPAPVARPATVARIELPRWLTEDHPSPPRVLVMSPPAHELALPQPAAKPAPAPQAPRPPPAATQLAASAQPAANPYQPPPLRRPAPPQYGAYYYGPYYAPPYWSPYPYGGQYGGAPW